MINDEEVKSFGTSGSIPTNVKAPFNWSSLPLHLLIKYRDEITAVLPSTNLADLNLEQELILQYHSTRQLQNDVLDEDTIPANQRAQVANAVATSLNKLADLQGSIYTSERFKKIENLLIRTLTKLPEEQAEAFIVEYEKILKDAK